MKWIIIVMLAGSFGMNVIVYVLTVMVIIMNVVMTVLMMNG